MRSQNVILVFLWVSLYLLVGCGSKEAHDFPNLDTGELEFSIQSNKQLYQTKEDIIIEATLKNTGVSSVFVSQRFDNTRDYDPDINKAIELLVKDQNGTELDYLCLESANLNSEVDYLVLKPFYSISRIIDLSCFDFALTGEYIISAKYHNFRDSPDGRLAWKGTLESNEIVIEILP